MNHIITYSVVKVNACRSTNKKDTDVGTVFRPFAKL